MAAETTPEPAHLDAGVIAAAGRIFDLFGNSTAWRDNPGDIYESADWAQAVLYAKTALADYIEDRKAKVNPNVER